MIRSTLLAACAGLALAGPAFAADKAAATAAAVRAADIAFAARAQAAGTAEAFREYMDEKEALEFGSGAPIKGAEAIFLSMGGTAKPKGKLEWSPTDAWGSAGGDMGVTTGTWKSTARERRARKLAPVRA